MWNNLFNVVFTRSLSCRSPFSPPITIHLKKKSFINLTPFSSLAQNHSNRRESGVFTDHVRYETSFHWQIPINTHIPTAALFRFSHTIVFVYFLLPTDIKFLRCLTRLDNVFSLLIFLPVLLA